MDSGHWPKLALNPSVVNDPKQTINPVLSRSGLQAFIGKQFAEAVFYTNGTIRILHDQSGVIA
jgi:hypothetical protein